MLTSPKIPFTALTIFCLGGAFLGIGVRKEHLDETQTENAMMVHKFASPGT
jgi:hypothetical protein